MIQSVTLITLPLQHLNVAIKFGPIYISTPLSAGACRIVLVESSQLCIPLNFIRKQNKQTKNMFR